MRLMLEQGGSEQDRKEVDQNEREKRVEKGNRLKEQKIFG